MGDLGPGRPRTYKTGTHSSTSRRVGHADFALMEEPRSTEHEFPLLLGPAPPTATLNDAATRTSPGCSVKAHVRGHSNRFGAKSFCPGRPAPRLDLIGFEKFPLGGGMLDCPNWNGFWANVGILHEMFRLMHKLQKIFQLCVSSPFPSKTKNGLPGMLLITWVCLTDREGTALSSLPTFVPASAGFVPNCK